ncbi:putative transcription factor/ chromatin remodeling BED-type(Zn) family protein [Tanacetum coccineum]
MLFNVGSKRQKPNNLGPMDKFTNAINPEGIPFHSIDNDGFKKFVEAVRQYGRGYRPPNQYLLGEPLLTKEVERTKGLIKKQEEEWAQNVCSVMIDGWTDRKRRSIMNFCVNSREGTTFLSSVECSKESHTGQFIFDYVDKGIKDVGPQNVIQVVTDNAANNMAASQLLVNKRPSIFWTSCAAHNIDLMLEAIGKEAIGKEGKFKDWIAKTKTLTIFIYAHHRTLALMRKFTKCKDIVRPGVTRFATSFLTLQSLMEKKEKLRLMFTSDEWTQSKWAKTKNEKLAYSIVMSPSFWNGVNLCLKVISPLIKVLRLVDGDQKPSMGFLSKGRLDSPLHLTAYLLNPYYFFKDESIKDDVMVSDAVFKCLEKFFYNDFERQDQVSNIELPKYKRKQGDFGRMLAAKGCLENSSSYDPGMYLVDDLRKYNTNSTKMAIKIISLTTSSSGCERNWSAFEGIHTKKRNRLDSQRLHDLVYVQFNAKLINKWAKVKNQNADVLRSLDASNAQSWIVAISEGEEELEEDGSNGVSGEAVDGRELHDDDFVSDEEQVEGGEQLDFNSDEESFI